MSEGVGLLRWRLRLPAWLPWRNGYFRGGTAEAWFGHAECLQKRGLSVLSVICTCREEQSYRVDWVGSKGIWTPYDFRSAAGSSHPSMRYRFRVGGMPGSRSRHPLNPK